MIALNLNLGFILFFIFINDLLEVISSQLGISGDDITIYFSLNIKSEIKLAADLKKIFIITYKKITYVNWDKKWPVNFINSKTVFD